MAAIDACQDSLPYIDPLPSDGQRAAAKALVDAQLPNDWEKSVHPRIEASPIPESTIAGIDLLSRASRKEKLAGIDISRYGDAALERPTSSPADPQHLQQWRDTLKRAYILYGYLGTRSQHLSLLEAYGKNAWLIGNSQVEEELRVLEKRLAEVKEQTDTVNRQRQTSQMNVQGEIEGLQQNWREGVGRLIEVQVATAEIMEEIRRLRQSEATQPG